MPMIAVKNLRKRFDAVEVLKGVSFDVAQGEVLVVIGPSGSGKSTMLRCLNFIEEYDDGEVLIDGELIGYRMGDKGRVRQKEAAIARMRTEIGMVFQSYNLFPHCNVIDNLTMAPINVKGVPKAQAVELAMDLLAKVGLADFAGAFPSRLSGGQQQRVAIARALAMQPKVVLFDEVTSALDPELVGEVLEVMRQLARDGHTMVIVTHEISFARDIGQNLLFMDNGLVVEEGPPADILNTPKTERLSGFLTRFHNGTTT